MAWNNEHAIYPKFKVCTEQKDWGSSHKNFESISEKSCSAIWDAYREIGVVPDEDGILDITVSYDGLWQKRGFTSHNGMASVIDLITGFVVHFEVLSNFWGKCKIAEDNKNNDEEWKAKHAPKYQKNF